MSLCVGSFINGGCGRLISAITASPLSSLSFSFVLQCAAFAHSEPFGLWSTLIFIKQFQVARYLNFKQDRMALNKLMHPSKLKGRCFYMIKNRNLLDTWEVADASVLLSFSHLLILYILCAAMMRTSVTNDCNYKARAWVVHFAQEPWHGSHARNGFCE